jgi:purine-nucleoside phosphorylase
MTNEWQTVESLAAALGERFPERPDVTVVLGSGLGTAADMLKERISVSTAELPGYPHSTVPGHAGMLHQGKIGKKTVLIQQGRVHIYEGYSPAEAVRPIRAAILKGAGTVILTNAAGGIDSHLFPGALMLIEDHLNLTGTSALLGPNDDERGPRFLDMSRAYDPDLCARMRAAAEKLDIPLASGVYAGLLGPTYETPAEVRMLKTLGAAAVGMSTVQEVIAARHLGAKTAAVSCITNLAAGLSSTPLAHDEVAETGAAATADMVRLLTKFLEDLA